VSLSYQSFAAFPTTLERVLHDLGTFEEQGSEEGVCVCKMRRAQTRYVGSLALLFIAATG